MNTQELIFIVEDDEFYAKVMKSFLDFKGHKNVQIYTNEKDALDNLYQCPSIILLDYNLDDKVGGGKDVLLEIVAFDPNIPVIFISGQLSIEEAIATLKLGAYDYIQKNDYVYERLEEKIKQLSVNRKKIELIKKNQEFKKKMLYVGVAASIVLFSILIF